MPSPIAFLYLFTKGWKVWNQLTRFWPLYLIRAAILFFIWMIALLLSQVQLAVM